MFLYVHIYKMKQLGMCIPTIHDDRAIQLRANQPYKLVGVKSLVHLSGTGSQDLPLMKGAVTTYAWSVAKGIASTSVVVDD